MTTAVAAPSKPVVWVDLFQGLFHANTPAWGQTLFAWGQLFHAEGRSNSELVSAVTALTRRKPMPKYPTEFLESLRDELRQQDLSMRQANEARRLDESLRPPRCPTCRDSGWICGLPHPDTVRGPEWLEPRWTCAVTCHCEFGSQVYARWANRQPEPKPVMSWLTYSRNNPHYQAQLDLRALDAEARVKTYEQQHGAAEWRKTVEAIVDRYRGQANGPR